MGPRGKLAALAVGLLVCAGCGLPAEAQPPARLAPADAQSQRIVAAANAFIASLAPEQKAAVQFGFDDSAQRKLWSNLPTGIVQRKGVRWGDLNAGQREKLMALLGQVLSPYGVQMVRDQMDADNVLKAEQAAQPPRAGPPPGGSPPGGPPPAGGRGPGRTLIFGEEHYYVAFLGQPSASAVWTMQFGGHHLGINATVAGPHLTLSPTLTGGQPTKFTRDGKTVYIVEREVDQANAMLASLNAAQRAKAVISPQRIDLVLGPGHDGQVLQPEGLSGAEMTAAQKAQFLKLISARLAIINDDDYAEAMAAVRRDIDRTYFAWWGPAGDAGSSYFRATGPTLSLEFSPQAQLTANNAADHLHNMYRNPTNEYGSAWTTVK